MQGGAGLNEVVDSCECHYSGCTCEPCLWLMELQQPSSVQRLAGKADRKGNSISTQGIWTVPPWSYQRKPNGQQESGPARKSGKGCPWGRSSAPPGRRRGAPRPLQHKNLASHSARLQVFYLRDQDSQQLGAHLCSQLEREGCRLPPPLWLGGEDTRGGSSHLPRACH